MLWDLLQWFVSLVEVIAVMAAILVIGLMIAMAAFWVLSRSLGKLAGPPDESDPNEYGMDDSLPASVPTAPNDASATRAWN
jgi:hypothetical protein